MKLPSESSSSWAHLGFAAYTRASVKAWSGFSILTAEDRAFLAELEVSLKGAMESLLKEARETENMMYFGRPEAMASQNAWMVLIKRVVTEILNTVIARVGNGSKDHPKVREFLPSLATGITKSRLYERPKLVEQAAGRLEKLESTFDEKAPAVARLRETAAGAHTAIDAADDAWTAWSTERSEEVVAKGRLRLELERVHHSLGARFPGQRDFVESFFLRGSKPSEGESEPETPAPPATEPQPPA
jgi:hypothetical protein